MIESYVQSGLLSGWTSGLLSGYVPAANLFSSSGCLRVEARPLNSQSHSGIISIVYREDGEPPITIWCCSPGANITMNNEILDWLFKRM